MDVPFRADKEDHLHCPGTAAATVVVAAAAIAGAAIAAAVVGHMCNRHILILGLLLLHLPFGASEEQDHQPLKLRAAARLMNLLLAPAVTTRASPNGCT